jgi:hypothetical protein
LAATNSTDITGIVYGVDEVAAGALIVPFIVIVGEGSAALSRLWSETGRLPTPVFRQYPDRH